jgi:predicted SnoaL-like aldol condensation-catalyzing enzyme
MYQWTRRGALAIGFAALTIGGAAAQENALERNKRNVVAFYNMMINDGKPEEAFRLYGSGTYIQHNPTVPDGAPPVIAFFTQRKKDFPEARSEIKRVIAEGDLVALHVHSRRKPDERGFAIVDIFRVDANGKIVEHWDVVQPVPENPRNDNGMF